KTCGVLVLDEGSNPSVSTPKNPSRSILEGFLVDTAKKMAVKWQYFALEMGLEKGEKKQKAREFQVLLKNNALLILVEALLVFHLGNGAILPLYGLAAVTKTQATPPNL
ncbi:MAG: hypothetical protein QM669_09270, partial [Siphonobacter sp.]